MPEEISNTDGQEKQDSEISAAKRLLPKIRAQHPRMPFIWMGDGEFKDLAQHTAICDYRRPRLGF
jgi:hypothetical protein